jgi:hypothetical protein
MKAYWDTFVGLIPCKVLRVFNAPEGHGKKVEFTLTANRGPYKRGETHISSALCVCPRDSVHMRSGQYRIGAYNWQLTE